MSLDRYRAMKAQVQHDFEQMRQPFRRKLEWLERLHRDNGFARVAASHTVRTRLDGPAPRYFLEQINPARAARRAEPAPALPPDVRARELSRLDVDFVPYSSDFRQFPAIIDLNRREYAMLIQPWPFGMLHFTVASTLAADPMGWFGSPDRLERMLWDLCALAASAEGMVALLNGIGAGASVLDRFHMQILARDGEWPLEAVCEQARDRRSGESVVLDPAVYPLAAWSFRGLTQDIVPRAMELIARFQQTLGEHATENLLATADGNVVTLYVIPRDARKERTADRRTIGSLETFGEVITETGQPLAEYEAVRRLLIEARPDLRID